MLKTLDLFSGIGGFSLGLERTGGFETVAFCEIEPFCRRVLSKHWPGVPIYEDVRELSADTLRRDGITDIDVVCGGFPCQDISFAGKRLGIEGARSGLWSEYARLIGELRPRFVIVENVPGLLSLGMGVVLGNISTLGYDAIWDCIPASAVGAPHQRDRVWMVAHSRSIGCQFVCPSDGCHDVSQNIQWATTEDQPQRSGRLGRFVESGADRSISARGGSWGTEPSVGRMADGVPHQLDRIRALGNSVVPRVAELIGRVIIAGA